MRPCLLAVAVLLLLPTSGRAQPAKDGAALSAYLQKSYAAVARDLVAVVELMPEQDFGFRPAGVAPEVRSFADIVHHVVGVNSWVCSMGEGQPDPMSAAGPNPILDKARLLTLLHETNSRCTAYLATLTDSRLTEVMTTRSASREIQAVRGNAAIFAIAHANEHYGNLVTYIRAKGLVPPAAASQAGFLTPVQKQGGQ